MGQDQSRIERGPLRHRIERAIMERMAGCHLEGVLAAEVLDELAQSRISTPPHQW